MPSYIFDPVARAHPKPTFHTVSTIADLFEASVTATAIRLVERRHFPAVLVCHGPKGRKWFTRSPDIPDRWFPQEMLDAESFAYGVLFRNQPNDPAPRKIGADAWFGRHDAGRFEVQEQTFHTGDDEILTLVLIRDGAMLDERDTQRPSYGRIR
jgi:hypothetical protein